MLDKNFFNSYPELEIYRDFMQRLTKFLSNAGVCSRRDAELLIKNRTVAVNGVITDSLSMTVGESDVIEVSGRVIILQRPRLWRYYKPVGLITTHKDTHDRATVFSSLDGLPRVISVGRLDLNSEGLLLLTNNGDLSRKFELPSSKIERTYKVRAYGNPDLIRNYKEIKIDEIYYNPKSIKLIKSGGHNSWFEVVLTEGKNREIRKIFEYFGLTVNRLIRIKYGDFLLGDLQPSCYKEVKYDEFKAFLE
jgi:23S rRNA pseudouridine2605 synthase